MSEVFMIAALVIGGPCAVLFVCALCAGVTECIQKMQK